MHRFIIVLAPAVNIEFETSDVVIGPLQAGQARFEGEITTETGIELTTEDGIVLVTEGYVSAVEFETADVVIGPLQVGRPELTEIINVDFTSADVVLGPLTIGRPILTPLSGRRRRRSVTLIEV